MIDPIRLMEIINRQLPREEEHALLEQEIIELNRQLFIVAANVSLVLGGTGVPEWIRIRLEAVARVMERVK